MPRTLRAGVIGGGIGASHAYAYSRHPGVDLVAACDLNPAVFDKFYERSKLAAGSVREYADYREMLDRERLDLVSVATPDDLHAEPVIDASNAGAKGIFCEKPIAGSLADADRMIDVVEANGTALLVDHTRCFEPRHNDVAQAVRGGYVGDLTRIFASYGGSRAMLFRNTTHLIGSVCCYAGADPIWVTAALDRGFEDYGVTYRGQGGHDPRLDPGATLMVEFSNGVRALVQASKGTPAMVPELHLFGTRGRILISDYELQAWQAEQDEGQLREQSVPWGSGIAVRPRPELGDRLVYAVDQLSRMVHAREAGQPVERGHSTARDARNVLEILLGALQSQARGLAPVRLPLPRS
jgi:predicted dehydrogenase